jgi:hypothetical protein
MDHERLLKDLMTPAEQERVKLLINKIATPVKKCKRTFTILRRDDVSLLLKAKYIRQVGSTATINVFRIAERHKGRARIISWPQDQNAEMDYDPEVALLDPTEIVDAVHPNTFVLAFDLTISFYQIRLPPEVARALVFEFEGKRYRFDVMPMGSRPSAEVMHRITDALSSIPDILKPYVTKNVHVDNVRFMSESREVLEQIKCLMKERLQKYRVSINEELEVATEADFYGLQFDHQAGMVSMTTRTKETLINLRPLLTTQPSPRREQLSLFGRLQYLSRVFRLPMYRYFHAMKFLRSISKNIQMETEQLDTVAPIWPSILSQTRQWLEQLIEQPAMQTQRVNLSSPVFHLYTDASTKGWGAILLCPDGAMHVAGARFREKHTHREITQLEVAAVHEALAAFSTHLQDSVLHLHVDNTAAKAGVARNYSPSFAVNNELGKVARAVASLHATISDISYVRSEDNPADHPSRGVFDVELLKTAVSALHPSFSTTSA